MDYDFKSRRWKLDIDSFNRWKPWVERLKDRKDAWSVKHTEITRQHLREIQQRWPQYIKEDEIP